VDIGIEKSVGRLSHWMRMNDRSILDAILAFGKVFSLDMERMAVILLAAAC